MASLSESFGTRYATQEVLERETSIPDGYDKTKGNVRITYTPCLKISETTISKEASRPSVFWTHDDPESLYKLGYPEQYANSLNCNNYLNEEDIPTDKDGNRIYYKYSCYNFYKMAYTTKLDETPMTSFDFTLHTPTYTSSPYDYVHYIDVLGRRMNSFNMFLSSRLAKKLEDSIVKWTTTKGGVPFTPLNATQLISMSPPEKVHIPTSSVKMQMSIHPNYLYWVVETLIRNYTRLISHGLQRFKFLYLVGEYKLNKITEIYPDAEEGKGISTYGEYRRELLNPANVVFYLKDNADVKAISDILCGLFPEKYDLAFGVPRFNVRLNRNVYISFGGNNETKYNLSEMFTPKEYELILETKNPAYNELSQMFSGHTLMLPNGTENNIQSYKKLIPFMGGGSFKDLYAYYGLMDYYNQIFGEFNKTIEQERAKAAESARAEKAKSVPKSYTKRRTKSLSHVRTVRILSKPRAKSLSRSLSKSRSLSRPRTNSKSSNKVKPNSPTKPQNRNSMNSLYDD